MIEIVSGTDRPGSNSLKLAKWLCTQYRGLGTEADVLDLNQLDLADARGGNYFGGAQGTFLKAVERVARAEGLVLIVPEYNGSFPGILKLFIDYWRYPESFEHRPMAMIGIGHRWGGLRPVEHLQQAMGYRNAYLFPNRVFINDIKTALKDDVPAEPNLVELLLIQTREFVKYIRALESQGLDANSKLRLKTK